MELHIVKEKNMELLSRKRIVLTIDNEGATPSRLDLVKEIAKKFSVPQNMVVIKHIYPQFGKKKTKLIVHIYQDKEKMAKFENENLIKKHQPPAKPAEQSA